MTMIDQTSGNGQKLRYSWTNTTSNNLKARQKLGKRCRSRLE